MRSRKNVLITGGAGFVGANFVAFWLESNPEDRVVVVDCLTRAAELRRLSAVLARPALRFVRADICDRAAMTELLEREKIDWVVHFAAETHVDESIIDPDKFMRANVIGTHTLLAACREVWSRRPAWPENVLFHHVSTDEVFGSLAAGESAFGENRAFAPSSPYSASKASSNHLVCAYHRTYGLPVTITNCSNNYGPYQMPDKLIPMVIARALAGRSIPIYGTGQNIRDWIHVRDHCRAIHAVLQSGSAGSSYNVGGNSERRNLDVVQQICKMIEMQFAQDEELKEKFSDCPAARNAALQELITHVSDRPGHDYRYAVDSSKIKRELRVAPEQTFESGLRATVDWYLQHESWWRSLT